MKKLLLSIICISALTGCSTFTPPRYSTDADNTVALRKIELGDIAVGNFADPAKMSNQCRGAGPIAPPDKVTFAEYIRQAFADELKVAGLYNDGSTPRVTLTGTLNSLVFSSSKGLTGGEWNIDLTLTSSNGAMLNMVEAYEFESGFIADTACKQTAEAYMGAVQNLIGNIVKSDKFVELLK
ncbi:hypothetical protein [Shewanella sp.]|uniref:hypothetical protein n=1 Tax=Shewanella sp. TaxID=50422 RepID=UPI0040487E50